MITSGSFLLSTQSLQGSYWQDKIVFLPEHNENGSWGLVLNHSARMPLDEVFSGLKAPDRKPYRFFFGGPVQEDMVQILEIGESQSSGAVELFPGIFLSGLQERNVDCLLSLLKVGPTRIFLGYAGWAPGQLEEEVERGAWEIVTPSPHEILSQHRDMGLGGPAEFKRQFVLS